MDNSNNLNYEYMLILKSPLNKKLNCILFLDLTFENKFKEYNTLSFTIPRYLYDFRLKQNKINPIWQQLLQGYKVEFRIYNQDVLIYKEDFVIQQPNYTENEAAGSQQVSCIPYHQYIFNKTLLRGFNDTRKLTECPTGVLIESEDKTLTKEGLVERNSAGVLIWRPCRDLKRETGTQEYVIGTKYNPETGEWETETTSSVSTSIIEYPEGTTYWLNDNTQGGVLDYILTYCLPDWGIEYYDEKLLEISQISWPSRDFIQNFWEGPTPELFDSDSKIEVTSGLLNPWLKFCQVVQVGEEDENVSLAHQLSALNRQIDGTDASVLRFQGIIHEWQDNFQQLCDIFPFYNKSGGKRTKIFERLLDEPLKGAEILERAETFLIQTQELIQSVFEYKFSELGYEALYGADSESSKNKLEKAGFLRDISILELFSEVTNRLLYQIISPLGQYYRNAPTQKPYRTMSFDTNLVSVFQSLEEQFLCVFDFNNIDKTIKIYGRNNKVINETKPLILTGYNYITEASYQALTDQIVTRLYPKGKDGITIGGYAVNGVNYVDNFNYFFNNNYIDKNSELGKKIVMYQGILKDIRTYQGTGDANPNQYNFPLAYLDYDEKYCISFKVTDPEKSHTEVKTMTIKQIQDYITRYSGYLSAARGYARSWLDAYYNSSFSSHYSGDKDNSLAKQAQREAAEAAQIEAETAIRTYVDYADINERNMRELWHYEWNEPQSNSYLEKNIYSAESALIAFQQSYQYENIRMLKEVVIDGKQTGQYEFINTPLFTSEDLSLLSNFIYEQEVDWNDVITADALNLYAEEYLEYINKIPITLTLNTADILSNQNTNLKWANIITEIGANLYVQLEEFALNYETLKLMSCVHTVSGEGNSSLSLVFSNSYELQNIYNQVIQDVWAYSYKQLKDLSTYRTSWEDYINKQNSLLAEGKQIYADVNDIVDSVGNKIVSDNGLNLSSAKHNNIIKTSNGYYSRDKTYSSTVSITKKTKDEEGKIKTEKLDETTQLTPDHIVFKGGSLTYDVTGANGETVLTLEGLGSGIPLWGSGYYYSTYFQATQNKGLQFYCEINGSQFALYKAIFIGKTEEEMKKDETDDDRYPLELTVYKNGIEEKSLIYWTDETHTFITLEPNDYPVMGYKVGSQSAISVTTIESELKEMEGTEEVVQVPVKTVITNNEIPYYIEYDNIGFAVKSDGIYQTRVISYEEESEDESEENTTQEVYQEILIPPIFIVDDFPTEEERKTKYRKNDLIFVSRGLPGEDEVQ